MTPVIPVEGWIRMEPTTRSQEVIQMGPIILVEEATREDSAEATQGFIPPAAGAAAIAPARAPVSRAEGLAREDSAKSKQGLLSKMQRTASSSFKGGVLLVGKGGLGAATAFKDFLLETDMAALMCAVVVGTAMTSLVKALVADILTPIIAAVFGGRDFNNLTFEINHSTFRHGHLINECISFIMLSFVTFFFLILPLRRALAAFKPKYKTVECHECLEKITKGARRCKQCTSAQPVAVKSVDGDKDGAFAADGGNKGEKMV